jgi:hypothetical protein
MGDSSAGSWLDIAQTMDVQQDLSSRSQDEIGAHRAWWISFPVPPLW